MTEYFRITGRNLIPFDTQAIVGADHRYVLGQSPGGMDEPMTEAEVRAVLPRLPQKIRGHALKRGLSKITFPFSIKGSSDPDMEDARHDLTETLEDGALYIATQGARGTRAALMVKANNVPAGHESYKTIVYGEAMELGGRAVLGAAIKQHFLLNLQMVLYCEPYWRPDAAVPLGPNEIYCPSFEENQAGRADNWAARPGAGHPTLAIENTIILHGCDSQKLTTDAANEGIESTVTSKVLNQNSAVAYAWICRPAAGSDIRVIMRDTLNNNDRAVALFSTAGWQTATSKDGINTFYQVVVSSSTLPNPLATYELWIESTAAAATVFYVDKCFWKWGTTTVPDEWCDHERIYNHYDTTEAIAHEGHQNYFDVDDLKGDVDARLLMRVELEQDADFVGHKSLIVSRNTRVPPVITGLHRELFWWLEAEDATDRADWADAVGGLARCSAGDCVSDAAAVTGHVYFLLDVAPWWPAQRFGGSFDVYGAVYTDDAVNTQFRLRYQLMDLPTHYCEPNPWVRTVCADTWNLLYLGSIDFDPIIRQGIIPDCFIIRVDYQKAAGHGGDVAKLDFLWLLRRDEPEMILTCHPIPGNALAFGEFWAIGQTDDFDYSGKENTLYAWEGTLNLRGEAMTLVPAIENRLYFVSVSQDPGVAVGEEEQYECHGAADALQMKVNIDYLPQYTSPLE